MTRLPARQATPDERDAILAAVAPAGGIQLEAALPPTPPVVPGVIPTGQPAPRKATQEEAELIRSVTTPGYNQTRIPQQRSWGEYAITKGSVCWFTCGGSFRHLCNIG